MSSPGPGLKYFDLYKERPAVDGLSSSRSSPHVVSKDFRESNKERRDAEKRTKPLKKQGTLSRQLSTTFDSPLRSSAQARTPSPQCAIRSSPPLRYLEAPSITGHEGESSIRWFEQQMKASLLPDLYAGPSNHVPSDSLSSGGIISRSSNTSAYSSSTVVLKATVCSQSKPADAPPWLFRSRTESTLILPQINRSNSPSSFSSTSSSLSYISAVEEPDINPASAGLLRLVQPVRTVDGATAEFTDVSSSQAISADWRSKAQPILSIDEIIRQNIGALGISRQIVRAGSAPPLYGAYPRSRTPTENTNTSQALSSIDSVAGEVLQSIRVDSEYPNTSIRYSRSQPSFSTPAPTNKQEQETFDGDHQSIASYEEVQKSGSSSSSQRTPYLTKEDIVHYLRSQRLTRLMTLKQPPNHHLNVSLADVGSISGHPVVVFLGLGCVRYLVALYDELAESLGLRLICIDRWGLGKTGVVTDSRRGFLEWATVVEEVLDQLEVGRFSIMAHSAGCPYALATAIRLKSRVSGPIHLLAPWISTASEGAAGPYKWLKYVPSSFIRTAQAAEWKMQSWKLGKPPSISFVGLGYDPKAPVNSECLSPVLAQSRKEGQEWQRPRESCVPVLSPLPSLSFENWPSARSTTPQSSPLLSASTESILAIPSSYKHVPDSLPSSQSNAHNRKRHGHRDGPDARENARQFGSVSEFEAVSQFSFISEHPSSSLYSTAKMESHNYRNNSMALGLDLVSALMQASHAESLKGGTSDLLALLERTSRPAGFSYSDVEHPVKVWHGTKDDKISLQSVLGLETIMKQCKVNLIPGADHSLMTNVAIVLQVLDSIAKEEHAY